MMRSVDIQAPRENTLNSTADCFHITQSSFYNHRKGDMFSGLSVEENNIGTAVNYCLYTEGKMGT